jgi:PIN domain nuclease of toxin-antitoxin system
MVILDTHILIWYVDDELRNKLSDAQLRSIAQNIDDNLGVSIVSLWEIAIKFKLGKIVLGGGKISLSDWFAKVLKFKGIKLLDISIDTILKSVELPGSFHKDPFDQLIVSTATCQNCALLTSDTKILAYPFVQCI